jgi:pimeloyl-ACP methyl ester carboxylesterase
MVLTGRSGFVQAGAIRLHYLEWPGPGSPLVLSPGTGLPAAVWEPFAREIPDHRRLAIDHRGHGDSDKPATGYDTVTLRDDLKRALEALGLVRPYGVGHSLGAVVMAAVEATYPGTFARLVLFDPALGPPGSQDFADRAREIAERTRKKRAVWPSRAALYQSYRHRDIFADWQEDAFAAYLAAGTELTPDGQVRLKCPPELEAQVFAAHPAHDHWADLARLDLPVLLVRGGATHVLSDELAARFRQQVRHAQEIVLPGAGHFLPMSHPVEAARIVCDFLAH